MSPKNQHARIVLAKNAGGTIVYCEGCNVVEIEMGAMSMRIDAPSLAALATLFKEADIRLGYISLDKADFEQTKAADSSFH